MMARKLAGLFALLALVAYFGTWLTRRFLGGADGRESMPLEQAWQIGIAVAALYFMLGLFMATLAIGLMQEMLAERRSRETERRFRARQTYESIVEGSPADRPAESAEPKGLSTN